MKIKPLELILVFSLLIFGLTANVFADWTTGKFTGAFEFDGTGDAIDMGDVGSVQTVEFWVYDLIATSTETTDGIMELVDDTTYIYVTSTSVIVTAGFNSPSVYVNGSDATTSLRSGWNHVAVVDSSVVNATSFTIGEANGDYFYGKIDEVRIYNRALSEAEIRFHYNRGGPVLHLRFDEGTGTTTYDSTEYYNHGTLGDGTCESGTGTCPTWIPGKYGPALSFDGTDDYVEVADSDSLDITEEITIDFWVNVTGELWECGDLLGYGTSTYETVQIGTQCWMAEDLNVGTRIDTCDCGSCTSTCGSSCSGRGCGLNEQDNDSAIEKYCYNDSESYCDTDGGLYQWWEAMDLPYSCSSTDCSGSINSPHQGICPTGWHIPTDDEWYTLTNYLEANSDYWCGASSTQIAKSLASQSGWSSSANTCAVGNNTSTNNLTGFTVLPTGRRGTAGSFVIRSNGSYLWSASQDGATNAWDRSLVYNTATVDRSNLNKAYGFSVRCIRD